MRKTAASGIGGEWLVMDVSLVRDEYQHFNVIPQDTKG